MFDLSRVVAARLGLVGLLMMSAGCSPLDDVMAGIFGGSMRDQPSFDPYEAPLPAPDGSVPFASGNFPARIGEVNVGQPEGLEDYPPPFTQMDLTNKVELVLNLPNPVPATEASLDRGEELFLRFCAPCHGPNGDGVSAYILPGGYPPTPLVADHVKEFTDGYIYGMIRVGGLVMPSYGHRITHFDRWNVVNYLRVLQGVASPPDLDEGGATPPPTEE